MAGRSARSTVGIAGVVAVLLSIATAAGGCEALVSDVLPDFQCVPGPDSCPSGMTCDPDAHKCVGACTSTSCASGTTCDPTTNLCVVVDASMPVETGAHDARSGDEAAAAQDHFVAPDTGGETGGDSGPCNTLGCACSGASACASQICADALTVTSALFAAAGNTSFCTKPCCTSADCDANTVCFATGQGGNYCVKPSWLRREAIGGELAGATCTVGEGMCRSGLCATGKCVDTCCSSAAASECGGGFSCQFGDFPGTSKVAFDKNYSAWCGAPPGGKTAGSSCSGNSSCQSDLCASLGGPNECMAACRGTSDCSGGLHCEYVIPPKPPTPQPIVGACFSPQGSLAQGSTCSTSADKCHGFCDRNTLKCTDPCFADGDCTQAGWRCRPELLPAKNGGMYSMLVCGP